MHHIQQRNAIDCGLAVVAMLAGCSYIKARQADPFPNKSIGLSLSDFLTTLFRCSGKKWIVRKPIRKPLQLSNTPLLCAVIIRQDGRKYGHWIAMDGLLVYDPELTHVCKLAEYNRRDWNVIRIVSQ